MNLRNYQAYSMAEALAAVKNDLGVDAVILRTRSWKRGGFLGIGRRTVFEITATTAADAPDRGAAPPSSKTRSRQSAGPSRRAVMAYRNSTPAPKPPVETPLAETRPSDRVRTQRLAQAILDQRELDQKEARTPAELNAAELNAVLRRAARKAKPVADAVEPLVSAENTQVRAERLTPGVRAAEENSSAAALVIGSSGAGVAVAAAPVAAAPVAAAPVAAAPVAAAPVVAVPRSAGTAAIAADLCLSETETLVEVGAEVGAEIGTKVLAEVGAGIGSDMDDMEPGIEPTTPRRSVARSVARRFVLTSAGEDGAGRAAPVKRSRQNVSGDPPLIETMAAAGLRDQSGLRAQSDPTRESGAVTRPPVSPSASPVRTSSAALSGPIEEELAAIRSMVGEVMRRQVTDSSSRAARGQSSAARGDELPPALFDWYIKLIGQEISEELADRIINQVRADLGDDGLGDPQRVRLAVRQGLAEYIPTAASPLASRSTDGRPLTIALVGPTGVGKTTTLAKLAATFKLEENRRVGLVTADTYRIAAVEQLRTYAEIIDLPLKVVQTPQEMRLAIQGLSECDVVLVDTAGRSQKDRGRIDELSAFIEAADPHEVHLVLSGTAGEKTLLQEAQAFSAVGVDRIVLSKLDETVSFGVLIDVVHRIGTELSFFTTGQEVPNHIEPSSPERLADLVLGGAL